MKLKTVLVFIASMMVTAVVSAQPLTQFTLRIYQAGTNTLVGTPTVIPIASVTVNVIAPTGSVVNPTKAFWDDINNVGKVVIYQDPGTGPLLTLPFSSTQAYEATLTATNSAGTSPESVRSLPFTRPGLAPLAPTGLKTGS